MNRTKLVLGAVTLGFTLLAGCSSNARIDQLPSNVQTLNAKVDQLSNNVNAMHLGVQAVKGDAVRANQRLDNATTKHHKWQYPCNKNGAPRAPFFLL